MSKNKYLLKEALSVTDSNDCIRRINEVFRQGEAPFLTDRASAVNCILFFSYMCQYITYEELCIFMGKYFTIPRIRQTVSSLINKKLLRRETFQMREGLSKNAYCLTRTGINYILPLLPPHLTRNIKVRRSGSIVPVHDYYGGITLMHFFLSSIPFTWEKETVIKNRLRPDLILHMRSDKTPSIIYIETDMGTEEKGLLLDKLCTYEELKLTEDSMIIYSMASRRTAPAGSGGLSKKFLTELLHLMKSTMHNSVYAFYEFFLKETYKNKILTNYPDFLSCFKEFLVWNGICRSLNHPESEMHTENLIRIGFQDLYVSDLESCLLSFSGPLNPYVQQYMNRGAFLWSFQKYLGMLSTLFYYINTAAWNYNSCLIPLFLGYPVYVLPAMLLSNYFNDMFFLGNSKPILASVQSYYPMITSDMYVAETELLYLHEMYPAVSFKNAYQVGGGLVMTASVYNMSALCQIKLCSSIEKSSAVKFLHFILLVDDFEQALSVHKLLGLPEETSEFAFTPRNAFLSVSYLKREDAGENERFFHVYSYQSVLNHRQKREPRYSLPRVYDTKGKTLHKTVLQKQKSGFYEVAGYTDLDDSIWQRIKYDFEEQQTAMT